MHERVHQRLSEGTLGYGPYGTSLGTDDRRCRGKRVLSEQVQGGIEQWEEGRSTADRTTRGHTFRISDQKNELLDSRLEWR